MIKTLRKATIVLALILLMTFLFSCGDDETKAMFSLINGSQQDDYYVISVPSAKDSINFDDYVQVSDGAKWKLYDSENMDKEIEKTVSLSAGENIFYVRVKQGGTKKDYKIKVTRKNALTITFDSNGGSYCQPVVVDEGASFPTPTTTRVGYDFVKWTFSNVEGLDVSAVAEWTPKTYQITINDGQVTVKNINFGEEYSIPAVSKTGYKFIKWIDANGKDFSASGVWQKAENVSITPVFQKETYKITYVYNADIQSTNATYTIDDEVILPIPTHPNGLEFGGWYTDSKCSEDKKVEKISVGSVGNKTFYAKWNQIVIPEEPVYHITIDADGYEIDGRVIDIKYGDFYVLPEIPERKGYEFVAWKYGNIVVPTAGLWDFREDVTLVIEWKPETFSIEYIIDEKTTNPNTIVMFTPESESIILLNPTRPNAEFVGWYTEDGDKITEISTGTTDDVKLYAKFDIKIHKLTYDANGGSVLKDNEEYETGESFVLLVPEYHGYVFKGWYNGDVLVENGVWNFDGDITLKAKWDKELYLITYDVAGGTLDSSAKKSYTIEDTFTLLKPTREGYIFLGWSEKDSNLVYNDMTVLAGTTGNKTYVANWSMFTYSFSGENAIVTSYVYIRTRSSVKIPSYVNYNGVDYTVTEIGSSIFSGIGTKLANKEIVTITSSGQKVATKFSVEIPKTLKKINKNAFYDCNDVAINVALGSGVNLSDWADTLEIAEGNDDVLDVIKGRRPAIGWSIYK